MAVRSVAEDAACAAVTPSEVPTSCALAVVSFMSTSLCLRTGRHRVVRGGRTPAQPDDALLIVNLDDIDVQYARITQATDIEIDPPVDQPYGPRIVTIRDPWGYARTFWEGHAIPPESTWVVQPRGPFPPPLRAVHDVMIRNA